MKHHTEFGLKQAKESKGNGSGIVTSEPLDMEAPQFEGHASRDSTFLVPDYVHADRGKSKGNGRIPHSEQSQPTVRQIDFTELEDGSLVEFVEDPSDSSRTLLAVYKYGQVSYTDRLELGNEVLVPLQRSTALLKHVRLPRGIRPYKTFRELLGEIENLISRCVVLDSEYVFVLASFVLSTWFVDRLPVAPYVSVVGLPQSGKTTLLKVLSLLCRRSLLTADITSAAFYDACTRLTPTLLIDETGTYGSNRYLHYLLRVGTTRDVVAMRRNQCFHAYGAKVISFLEPPDDPALNSRCILIPMSEANESDLVAPTDPDLEEQAAQLQESLLLYRLDHYKKVRPVKVSSPVPLRPRARDLLRSLTAPSLGDSDQCRALGEFLARQDRTTRDPLSPPQNGVLKALFYYTHLDSRQGESDYLMITELTFAVNEVFRKVGERFQLKPRKVGSILTSLGFFNRQRTRTGWVIWLDKSDREKIHRLAQTHGIDSLPTRALELTLESCKMCQETKKNQYA